MAYKLHCPNKKKRKAIIKGNYEIKCSILTREKENVLNKIIWPVYFSKQNCVTTNAILQRPFVLIKWYFCNKKKLLAKCSAGFISVIKNPPTFSYFSAASKEVCSEFHYLKMRQ